MLNLTIKIRPHLQKSSHLDFSPKIAIFVLSCKEIWRRRRQNGQAGVRPCKITVGDAGIGFKKVLQTVDIHQAYKCAGAPLSAQRSLFPRLLCVTRPGIFHDARHLHHTDRKPARSIPCRFQFKKKCRVFRQWDSGNIFVLLNDNRLSH